MRSGARWCILVFMRKREAAIRQSVSIPARVVKRVRAIAEASKTSSSRVLVDLIEAGLESKESEKTRFFALADRLTECDDPAERQKLKKELARMTFGS